MVGGAQLAVSVTGNTMETKAETKMSCTPTCSSNGTHSDGYTGAFEGPEKLLEMWFAPSAEAAAALPVGQDASYCTAEEEEEPRSRGTGLRRVPVAVWRDMLDLVHCQILSTLSNAHVDSYLLSESSFFVYPHKLVLKTCGTTTLLYAVPRVLEIARVFLGTASAYQLFYSRKNFMFPDQQEELHRSWESEVSYLDALFPDGSAYMIGKTNRDHWHVYLAGPYEVRQLAPPQPVSSRGCGELIDGVLLLGESTHAEAEDEEREADGTALSRSPLVPSADATVNNSAVASPLIHPVSRTSSRSTVQEERSVPEAGADTTVEILMTGLDPERMRTMYLGGASSEEGSSGGKAVERVSGISGIYPDSASDSYLFTPCGFSLNGLQGDGYYTIHVTPEPHCSYASFETNVSDLCLDLDDPKGIKRLVEQVTQVFGPRYVTVTVFKARPALETQPLTARADSAVYAASAKGKYDGAGVDAVPPSFSPVAGYKSVDRVLYEFDHYWLRYAYYVRSD
ncbi:spermidine resistance protein [Coemansia sp. RSA 1358]|nr:spermidine resistance protein [Coemansia sp. RSA 1358]